MKTTHYAKLVETQQLTPPRDKSVLQLFHTAVAASENIFCPRKSVAAHRFPHYGSAKTDSPKKPEI
jgi:hypothetical protein